LFFGNALKISLLKGDYKDYSGTGGYKKVYGQMFIFSLNN